MLQLFVNGPPGSGKTTVAKRLCDEFRLELVATGELLRENMSAQTPLGREAQRYIAAKTLIPDRVVVDMVALKMGACERQRRGWVLDGFPRTPDQCRALQRDQRLSPAVALVLELPERECVARVAGRRFDPLTSRVYHCDALAGVDPAVAQRLVKRADDAPDKLPPRFEAYRTFGEQTNALLAPIVHRVDASGPPEAVLDQISALLLALARSHGSRGGGEAGALAFRPVAGASIPRALTDRGAAGGNQSQQLGVGVVIPGAHASIAASRSSSLALGKAAQFKKQVPQRIEEEEEEVEIDDAGGEELVDGPRVSGGALVQPQSAFDYDNDDDRDVDSKRRMTLTRRPSATASPQSETDKSHAAVAVNTHTATVSPSNSSNNNSSSNNNNEDADEQLGATSVTTPAALTHNGSDGGSSSRESDGFDMVRFRNLLLDGFDVLKHGRRGSPHTRTVFADVELKRVFWQKPAKDRRSKKARLEQSLLLADVLQVVRGMKTDVLKRSGDVAKYERYLSLVADDRTLDLELPSDEQSEFLRRGFERLLLHQGDGRAGL